MNQGIKAFAIGVILLGCLTVANCTGETNACTGFTCDAGFSCLIVDGNPSCVADGGINGGGQNGPGEECDDDADCQTGLTCQADLNGNLTCTQ